MRRREKFVISSILLSLTLLGVQYVSLEFRFVAVAIFTVLSYIISAWALSDDLYGIEWLTIIPFPALYAFSVGLFYFLLPSNVISRVSILALFGVGMYALYLTGNIYSVAKARTIQLLRAAHTIGLLFTLLISLLLTNTVFSLHFPFWLNGLAVLGIHFPLLLMAFWSVELKPVVERKIVVFTIAFSFILAECACVLSFLAFDVWASSLLITSLLYIVLGLLHARLQDRLFKNTMWEYLYLGLFLSFLSLFLMEWK